jgi:hypothetical protein
MRRASAAGRGRFLAGIVVAALGIGASSAPAFAELRTFILSWTSPGDGSARGTLTLDDAICDNPGMNNFAGPEGCFVELTFTVTGDTKGKGTYTLDDMNDVVFDTGAVALDLDQELVAQGPNDINFFGDPGAPGGVDPFVMAPSGGEPADQLTLTSVTPLAFPFAAEAAKCSGAVGKAGGSYFAARHKALHACRSALTKGAALFADKAKTVPVLVAGDCAVELETAARIAKARRKLRGAIVKKCSDAALVGIPACATSVDALADPAAEGGCLIESVDFNVDEVVHAEFGF